MSEATLSRDINNIAKMKNSLLREIPRTGLEPVLARARLTLAGGLPPIHPLCQPRGAVHLGERGSGRDFAFGHAECDFLLRQFRCHQSVTISRIFITTRLPSAKELPHDRFGSRRSRLRSAGAWPFLCLEFCLGRRQGLQARRSRGR